MKPGFTFLACAALAMLCLAGCDNPLVSNGNGSGSGNGSSSSTSTETLWNDGKYGTWFGAVESTQMFELGTNIAAVADTLTGSPKTLLISSNSNAVPDRTYLICTLTTVPSASAVLSGHVVFDAMLASPMAGAGMTVAYSPATAGTCFTSVVNLGTLSVAAFTQVSIPVSSFVESAGCAASPDIQEPFYLSFTGVGPNTPMVYLSDIQWTSN